MHFLNLEIYAGNEYGINVKFYWTLLLKKTGFLIGVLARSTLIDRWELDNRVSCFLLTLKNIFCLLCTLRNISFLLRNISCVFPE